MSTSLPSPRISIIDVPDVRDFRAKFVYNFFATDESYNDTSVAPDSVRRMPAESFDAERIENVRRVVPRFVEFDFSPPSISHVDPPRRVSITRNINQIQDEEDFSGKAYTALEFQDNNLDKKLFTIVSGSVAKRIAQKNRNIESQIDENYQTVLSNLSDEHSLMDAARALASDTSDSVSNNVIINALNQIDALKLKFIDESATKVLTDQTFDRVKNIAIKGQFSNKIIGKVVTSIKNDPMSPFADEFASPSLGSKLMARQKATIAKINPRIINRSEYESTFRALSKQPIDTHDTTSRIVGYIIEKAELTDDGKLKMHPPIIIESATKTTAVDLRVAYGLTYIYTIRTVAQIKVHASYNDLDDIVLATGLVKSKRSARVFVKCVEDVPPPSVADFNVIWNYASSAPLLVWSFPVNPQRDIKRFQIFRRSSTAEPFQLIKELDFDDSDLRIDNGETPAPDYIEKLNSPVTSFLDTEFTKHSKFIYAICSIDAHGLSSNYSSQLEVSFDVFKNSIKKRLISNAGAPKSYPNMCLLQDTFVDTIKTSGNTRIKVVFDPEFLKVFDRRNNDMHLFVTEDNGGINARYRLQLINTDIQKQEVVDISIKDRRQPRSPGHLRIQ